MVVVGWIMLKYTTFHPMVCFQSCGCGLNGEIGGKNIAIDEDWEHRIGNVRRRLCVVYLWFLSLVKGRHCEGNASLDALCDFNSTTSGTVWKVINRMKEGKILPVLTRTRMLCHWLYGGYCYLGSGENPDVFTLVRLAKYGDIPRSNFPRF